MYKIPKQYRDLRRHVLWRDAKKLLGYVAWVLFFLFNALFYNYNHQTYPIDRQLTGWRMALFMAIVAVVGFFVFRLWTFLTDRTYTGVIRTSGLSHSYSPPDEPYGIKAANYDFRTNTKLTVVTDKQKKHRLRFEQKQGSYWYYNEGERILHFHGLPYPLNLDTSAPHGYICLACGRVHKEYQPECEFCFLALVDPKEVHPYKERYNKNASKRR